MTTASVQADVPSLPIRVCRVEVRPVPGEPDTHAQQHAAALAAQFGPQARMTTARIYLIQAPLSDAAAQRLADQLLADPINQTAYLGAAPAEQGSAIIEVHYQPGVMDPVAQSTRGAIVEMLGSELNLSLDQVQVQTGYRYDIAGTQADAPELERFAQTVLANPVIEEIHLEPFHPRTFPQAGSYQFKLIHVPIRDLDDAGLQKLSREGHLFLSLDEMKAVQSYYRDAGREPTDIELETLAQTWSEHCVHKTLKSTIHYQPAGPDDALSFANRPGHEVHPDGSVTIHNLLKSTVAAATHELMAASPHDQWCVSVFVDNAGIVRFDDQDAVCIKVETHNHPSAIEPYGGAATGIGGCIRDVMGTGLAARPIANTDVFCVAYPTGWDTSDNAELTLPSGVIHPRRVLQRVVAGVRDYGNRMGIPTISGAVWFHDDYVANPLVFAGCVGLLPLDKCFGDPRPGDRIIALGGATGRDGIHGATFSSAELTDTHADEFAHAVQIGNAITQKKMMDVILEARDVPGGPLFNAITDCGAGGFSSAVGEMGEKVGARVQLEKAPLKYAGLSYTEIWISEAQERMVLSVSPDKAEQLRQLCESQDVGFCDLGEFGHTSEKGEPLLTLTYQGQQVGQLAMHLLHEGIPTPTRRATWRRGQHAPATPGPRTQPAPRNIEQALMGLLGHPNIASKHWIIQQYDYEVQGSSTVKPLVGPYQDGPSDAAVVRPKLNSDRGVAIACGLQPGMSEKAFGGFGDSYWATLAAIDEAVRNVVCVGADPQRIAILDNFCWPRCEEPENLGSLVRAAEACYDGAMAYRTPFVSGKDSLSNQFTTEDGRVIAIPPTLLVTAMGIVPDVKRCRTMDAKAAGNLLLAVGQTTGKMGGSHYLSLFDDPGRDTQLPRVDLQRGPSFAHGVAELIAQGLVVSAHDCSDGGMLLGAAEMAFAGRVGLEVNLSALPTDGQLDDYAACFAETPSRYLLELKPEAFDTVARLLNQRQIPFGQIGRFALHDRLKLRSDRGGELLDVSLDDLRIAWQKPLDW